MVQRAWRERGLHRLDRGLTTPRRIMSISSLAFPDQPLYALLVMGKERACLQTRHMHRPRRHSATNSRLRRFPACTRPAAHTRPSTFDAWLRVWHVIPRGLTASCASRTRLRRCPATRRPLRTVFRAGGQNWSCSKSFMVARSTSISTR